MNAVIVDIKGKYAAALGENGNVIKILNANYVLGQKVQLHELQQRRHVPSMKRIGTIAAVAALALSIGTGTAYALPYGTVSLDADAAIEYTINRFDRVLSVRALNEEGEAILSEIDPQSLRFRHVEQAITVTLDVPELSADETPAIRITASTRDERHSERLQEQLMEQIPAGSLPPELQPEHAGLPGSSPAPEMPEDTVRPEDSVSGNPRLNPGVSQAPPDGADGEQDASHTTPETPETEPATQEGPDSEQMSPHDQAAPFEPGREGTLEPPSGMPASSPGPTGAHAQDSGAPAMPQSENGAMATPQQDSPGGPPPGK